MSNRDEKIDSITEILSRISKDLYNYFINKTNSEIKSYELVSRFLTSESPFDDLFANAKLDNNPKFYKKLLIVYMSLKSFMCQNHNKEFGVDYNKEIFSFLENADINSLLTRYYKDKEYRITISKIGLDAIFNSTKIRNYKDFLSILKTKKQKKIMNIMPSFFFEYFNIASIEEQDLIISDVLEYFNSYSNEVWDEIDDYYDDEDETVEESDDDEDETVEESIDDEDETVEEFDDDEDETVEESNNDVNTGKEIIEFCDFDTEYEAFEGQDTILNCLLCNAVYNKIVIRYKNDPDSKEKIGFIIGNTYSYLVENKNKLPKDILKYITLFEQDDTNLDRVYSLFIDDRDFGVEVIKYFIQSNNELLGNNREKNEKDFVSNNREKVKVMTKFDKYYKEK